MKRARGLRIGIAGAAGSRAELARRFPNLEFVLSTDPNDFLDGREALDAFIMSGEAGELAVWQHPEFVFLLPQGMSVIRLARAYGLPRNDGAWKSYVNRWLDVHIRARVVREAYEHWILGRIEKEHGPRWCIARDVLGWME